MNGKISKESWLIKMIKQIISDLDGTLLNGQHILDESDSRLLEELQRKGIAFAVASGRSYDSAKGIVGRYGLQCDYIILNGAAVCSDAGELLDEVPFSKEQLQAIVEILLECKQCFFMYGSNGTSSFDGKGICEQCLKMLVHHGLSENVAKQLIEEGQFHHIDVEYERMEDLLEEKARIYKIELFINGHKREALQELLKDMEGISITTSGYDNIEITSNRAQKGITLERYCEKRGLSKEEVLIFGDSLNDCSMFERFPFAIAMANACDEIKAIASYSTAYNTEHGVAKVLQALNEAQGSSGVLKSFQNFKK